MVLMVPEPLSVKLVVLKVAMPLVEASALALSMVMVERAPVELAGVNAPVRPSRLVTPPPGPPVQAEKLNVPEPSVCRQSPLLPSAVGRVKARLLAVTPDCRVRVLALVALFRTMAPVFVLAVPSVRLPAPVTLKVPVTVMALPDWVITES